MSTTFAEVIDLQCAHMARAAKRLDDKGYIVFVYNLNRFGESDAFPHRYFNGAMWEVFHQWRKANRRAVVSVRVVPSAKHVELIQKDGKPFDHPFTFVANIPRARRCREIVAALELMATTQKGRSGPAKGVGMLRQTQLSDRFEFIGEDRAAFETLLRVLEMPHHKALLTRTK